MADKDVDDLRHGDCEDCGKESKKLKFINWEWRCPDCVEKVLQKPMAINKVGNETEYIDFSEFTTLLGVNEEEIAEGITLTTKGCDCCAEYYSITLENYKKLLEQAKTDIEEELAFVVKQISSKTD